MKMVTVTEKLLKAVATKAKSFKTSDDRTSGLRKKLMETLWTAYTGTVEDSTKADDNVIKQLESTLVDEGGLEVQSAKNIVSKTLRSNGVKRRETKQDKEDKKAAKQNRAANKVGNKRKNATAKDKLEQLAVNLSNGDKAAAQKLAHSVYESLKKQVAADAKKAKEAQDKKTLAKGKEATGTDKVVSVPRGESIPDEKAA